MSIDFEERLRADMGQVQVRPRPGLAREAHRRYQRGRRRTALAVAATGTAAAVAGATAGFALTAGGPGTGPIETTAYVVSRVNSALAATHTIGYAISRLTGPGTPAALNGPTEVWQFGERTRTLAETAADQLAYDSSSRPQGHGWVLVGVNYRSRTWWSLTLPPLAFGPVKGTAPCGEGAPGLIGADAKTAADWRRVIETGLTCGAFTVVGRQRIDGVDAIKLAGHHSMSHTNLWIDPRSYLPVRLVTRELTPPAAVGAKWKPATMTLTIDFRWLSPTRANLAKLTAPIPPGFHQVSFP